jgi:hypothetical protein
VPSLAAVQPDDANGSVPGATFANPAGTEEGDLLLVFFGVDRELYTDSDALEAKNWKILIDDGGIGKDCRGTYLGTGAREHLRCRGLENRGVLLGQALSSTDPTQRGPRTLRHVALNAARCPRRIVSPKNCSETTRLNHLRASMPSR